MNNKIIFGSISIAKFFNSSVKLFFPCNQSSYVGDDRGIVPVSGSRQFTVDQPALNIGAASRRVGGDGDPGGMRSVRPTDDSSVPCRDSLATRELAPSSFGLGCTLLTLPFSSSPFSLFFLLYLSLFYPFFSCRSFTRTRSYPRRSRACDASLRYRPEFSGAGRVCATTLEI